MGLRLTTAIVLLFAAEASAQSMNIDFGAGFGAPGAGYGAAAGQPGVWNLIPSLFDVPVPLNRLNGAPTAVNVLLVGGPVNVVNQNDPGTSGDDQALMDDAIGEIGDITFALFFRNLIPGAYDVYTYAWPSNSPTQRSSVWLNNDINNFQDTGGPWPGGLQLGVTHALHHGIVPLNGQLLINIGPGNFGSSGYVNGVQLVMVPGPGAATVFVAGALVLVRRRRA